MNSWLYIYRTYSAEELTEEIAFLKTEIRNIYTSQAMGQKQNTRDVIGVKNRLEAAIIVSEERAGRPIAQKTVADFSGGVSGY